MEKWRLNLSKLKKQLRNKYFWISLSLLIFGILVNQLVSIHLDLKYGDNLPALNDFILDNIPYIKISWIYDILTLTPIILFIIYVYKKDIDKVPYFLLLFGFSQLLRGLFIGLTPFGLPQNHSLGILKGSAFRKGCYPSGHTGASFLSFLMSKGVYKYIIFVFFILVILALLLGRGHYSIDIFSAIIFQYAIYCFGEKYFKRKFEQKFKNFK